MLAVVTSLCHTSTLGSGFGSKNEHPQHPPDKEYRDDGPRDVNYPVTSCFWFSKIEHAAMVAGPKASPTIVASPGWRLSQRSGISSKTGTLRCSTTISPRDWGCSCPWLRRLYGDLTRDGDSLEPILSTGQSLGGDSTWSATALMSLPHSSNNREITKRTNKGRAFSETRKLRDASRNDHCSGCFGGWASRRIEFILLTAAAFAGSGDILMPFKASIPAAVYRGACA